jgi:hypothetical protein
MENLQKPKPKIPLFSENKASTTFINMRANTAVLTYSSDSSDIFEDLSDNDNNEENINYFKNRLDNQIKTTSVKNIFKPNNLFLKKNTDDFKDIEEYVANSAYDIEKLKGKNLNKIYDNKNKNKDKNKDKIKDKKIGDEKNEPKIINDFFINNEGDIELSANNIKDSKNKQKNSNNNITKSLGPLMEEDENNKNMSINHNKSIFGSIKDLWKFQKILLENDIIDIISK